ncbi:MAG TPA: HAD family hydrolase [Candidatus Limnocylindrales bacterium]|nr:HAD family hydrolase [Candidatus Limnocylindrales bacterium]
MTRTSANRTCASPAPAAGRLDEVGYITFDFGNTLVPVDRAALRRVVELTGEWAVRHLEPVPIETFHAVWAEERERQFREEIPRFREADLAIRFGRVIARLRGLAAPPPDVEWDDAAAAERSDPGEIAAAVEVYSRAFVEAIPPPPDVGPLLARLSADRRLGILSNWPFAATIDRYVEAAGWAEHLAAVVVSQRVGSIKPHPSIFAAAQAAIGAPSPAVCLHVGDDWAADVVGAIRAGWRAAHVHGRPEDSPLPSSEMDGSVEADLELAALADLEAVLPAREPEQ